MFKLYRQLFLATILSFSTSLVCMEEKEREKIDPSCHDGETTENVDETTRSQNETVTPEALGLPTSLELRIRNDLAALGIHEPDTEKAMELVKFLKPYYRTLATVLLCRLSEKVKVNRNQVDKLIELARPKDLKMVLPLLKPGKRHAYVMGQILQKAYNAPAFNATIEENEEQEQFLDPENISVLSVAMLGHLGNMDNPDMEKVEMLVGQANYYDLEIALAINTYTNPDVKIRMLEKVLNEGIAKVKETYQTKHACEENLADLRKDFDNLEEDLKAQVNAFKELQEQLKDLKHNQTEYHNKQDKINALNSFLYNASKKLAYLGAVKRLASVGGAAGHAWLAKGCLSLSSLILKDALRTSVFNHTLGAFTFGTGAFSFTALSVLTLPLWLIPIFTDWPLNKIFAEKK